MKGVFTTCQLSKLAQVEADIKIVGTIKQIHGNNIIWVPQLAPSSELFNLFQDWKKDGLWPAMWNMYVAKFRLEMAFMKRYLDRIVLRLNEGKNVAFACFCSDYNYCHRSLIAQYIESEGFIVRKG